MSSRLVPVAQRQKGDHCYSDWGKGTKEPHEGIGETFLALAFDALRDASGKERPERVGAAFPAKGR